MRRIAALIVALMTAFGLMGTAVFWLHPPRIHAAPETLISVTTTLDELDANGLCSLREAIQAANTDTAVDACAAGSGENDVISIPAGHYLLTLADPVGVVEENGNATGDLDILHSVALVGAGSAQTIIDGNGIDRVFHQPGAATQVTVSDVTVQGGDLGVGTSVNYSGGGFSLISGCALTLTNVLVTQNQASPGQPLLSSGGGGGIYNNGGQLTLQNVTVSGNIAGFGGGVYNGGRLTIINSSILSNQSTYY
ncbi:MAG: CSLREA domain-containing protein, partial [Candidatus Promineifilaceae bacterium]